MVIERNNYETDRKGCGMSNILMWILIILGIVVILYLLVQFIVFIMAVFMTVTIWIKEWKEIKGQE